MTEVPEERAGRKKNTKEVDLVAKLFDEIAPKYVNRNGGYTRIIKMSTFYNILLLKTQICCKIIFFHFTIYLAKVQERFLKRGPSGTAKKPARHTYRNRI